MSVKLWESFRIGRMELRNRIVMPPMVTRYASDDGFVTERTKNYYGARAQGGAGLIIVEATYVHRQGNAFVNQLGISDDKFIPGMKELVDVVHKHGAKIAVQLHHGGREAKSTVSGLQPVAPSPLPGLAGETPREMTVEEIAEAVAYFAEAALRAEKIGFDGAELHAAHGYLIDQFLSPTSNKRKDEYGGDVNNRARFLLEVIAAVKEAVGEDYPVWCRMDGKEYGVEGITLEDAQKTARMVEDAGLAAIHVSAWGPATPTNRATSTFVPAIIEELAEGIKKVVSIPIIAVGRITPEDGERMLKEDKADLIAVGKAMLADVEWVNKVASGKTDDINPCIICNGCRDDIRNLEVVGIRCSVNATLGREKESEIVPVAKPKNVLVIGGGPAGMEAARVAALRGHKVTLWERESRLGGQLVQAAIPPYKDRIAPMAKYLETQLQKIGVRVQTGKEATAAAVAESKPDVVVVATGVRTFTPDIPGLDKTRFVEAGDVLEGKVKVGDKVAIIGGELVGCETAEFLADRGKQVTVMRRGPEMATSVGPSNRAFFLSRLLDKGVTLLREVRYNSVSPEGVNITTKDGEERTIEADNVVLAAGSVPDTALYEAVKGKISEVYSIGDCVEPRTIRDAISEGFRTGQKI
jgi:2,4-dienoyl-CoA reductase-like NADH-dependent reductase (Old Yellow Enzyme family)/NADPH-dependent 2,4-dienoyl-CoA reductase/sulfur reductase-like enzyme